MFLPRSGIISTIAIGVVNVARPLTFRSDWFPSGNHAMAMRVQGADCAKCSIAGTGLTRGGIHSRLGPGCQGILVPACARAAISS